MKRAAHGLFVDADRSVLRRTVSQVLDTLDAAHQRQPCPALSSDALAKLVQAIDPLPEVGVPMTDVLAEVGDAVLANGVRPTDPRCAAHLHSPPLLTAAAAELAIGVTNQSMDSFDQAPAATHVEDHLVRRLAATLGLPAGSSGVMTAGGTSSNLLGLMLARERAWRRAGDDRPLASGHWRIVAAESAHVSIRQAAAVLGLGHEAVIPVAVDQDGRMDVLALDALLRELQERDETVIAIVGTAGTTDAGAIDPLDELADRAAAHDSWFHVDAAVGAGLALSDRLRLRLAGLERADSVTADLHKLWWQPISASALLVRDDDAWTGLREPADYLNRADDDVLNLVDRSLDTSRRFDALKVLISLRTTGRRQLAELVEHVVDLASHAASLVDSHEDLELLCRPQTVTVLFRCHPPGLGDDELDSLNVVVQRDLLATGRAVVGRTRHEGRVSLKLTLVNPLATRADLAELLDIIAANAVAQGVGAPA